jgi:hypothetical protein
MYILELFQSFRITIPVGKLYLRLTRQIGLCHQKRNLSRLLKLHRLLRMEGVTTDKIQLFVNMARIGAYKIRDPEGVCKAERQLEVIDNKKLVLKHELEDINNRTAYLRIIMSQL